MTQYPPGRRAYRGHAAGRPAGPPLRGKGAANYGASIRLAREARQARRLFPTRWAAHRAVLSYADSTRRQSTRRDDVGHFDARGEQKKHVVGTQTGVDTRRGRPGAIVL